jgi:hypothetical protein
VFSHDVEFPVGYIWDRLCSVRNWFDESVKLAVNERDADYKIWHENINKVRGDGGFMLVNLNPSLPLRKLYQNLRRLVLSMPLRGPKLRWMLSV